MRALILFWIYCLSTLIVAAQQIERVEPPNWWTDIPITLQLTVYGPNISEWHPSIEYPGVQLLRTTRVENRNYLFLDIAIADTANAGIVQLTFSSIDSTIYFPYRLQARDTTYGRVRGLQGQDVMYLLYPDRFANGDTANDKVPGMLDQQLDRGNWSARHGGDLQGIIQHLGYFDSLGFTALWLNPVFTNDEARDSYHGYAATDLYAVDPRLGSNEVYRSLGDSLQNRNMALVMDLVHNHVGSQHWMAIDPPKNNWFNQWPAYTHSNFKAPALHDPYAAPMDREKFTKGWFAPTMPDLNQAEPLLQQYLIQQAIWWVEYAGVDAFRLDTYAFSDPGFLQRWTTTLKQLYPNLFLFGETFVFNKATQVYFHGANTVETPFRHRLDAVTDFQWYFAVTKGLAESFGWTTGWSRVYNLLTQDYLLKQPVQNILFLDNHDTDRIATVLADKPSQQQQALVLLLTQRGIPCLYYGTEWQFTGRTNPDGKVRTDFPGGWPGDSVNYFDPAAWPDAPESHFRLVQQLAIFRATHPWFGIGEMRHFIPQEGIYAYFRYANEEALLVVLNSNTQQKVIRTTDWDWPIADKRQAFDVLTKQPLKAWDTIAIPAEGVRVIHITP